MWERKEGEVLSGGGGEQKGGGGRDKGLKERHRYGRKGKRGVGQNNVRICI